jgi:hypothetical protein
MSSTSPVHFSSQINYVAMGSSRNIRAKNESSIGILHAQLPKRNLTIYNDKIKLKGLFRKTEPG